MRILFAIIVSLSLSSRAGEINRTVPLKIESSNAISAQTGTIGIFRNLPRQQSGDKLICLEAENYNDIFWQGVGQETTSSEDLLRNMENRGKFKAYSDPQASGGKYIERMTLATYYFGVADPGKYTIWYRFYMPRKANWQFNQHLSRVGKEDVKLNGPVKQWFWQKGSTYDLKKMSYRLQLAFFHNGKRIDKIVFSRDPNYKPTGTGPAPTPVSKRLRTGRVDFVPVEIAPDVKSPTVKFTRLNKTGILLARYTLDNGKHWKTLAGDGKLALPANKTNTVKLQFFLKPDKNGKYPEITLPELMLRQNSSDYAVLENSSVAYIFNRKTGGIDSIRLKGESIPVKLPDTGIPVFSLMLKPDNNSTKGKVILTSADFKTVKSAISGNNFSCEYFNSQYNIRLVAVYTLTPVGFLDTRLTVKNNDKNDILETTFPIISQVRIGPDANDDILIWPLGTGKKFPAPVSKSAQTAYYPRAGLGYFDIYDKQAGFYMANHDPGLYSTVMNAAPDEARTWMNFNFIRRNRIKANGGNVNYRYAFGAHHGDWHRAALWYKAWYRTVFPDYKPPTWLAESNGWLFDNLAQAGPHSCYRNLPALTFRRAILYGLPHVQIWGTDGANSCQTYFMPPEFMGGPEAMKQASQWWKQRGGKVGYYILGQGPSAWCFSNQSKAYFGVQWKNMPDWAVPPGKKAGTSEKWLMENARYDHQDRRTPENHRSKTKAQKETAANYPWDYIAMSNYSKPWNNLLLFWVVDKYLRDWGCKTVYLDTFHTQADNPDFNPFLKLHGEGQGGKMRSLLAKELFERGRKIDPDFLPVMEMQCDAYTPWMAIQCSSSAKDTEMYKFTHPECKYFQGHTAQGTRGLVRFERFSSCWLYGNLFDHRLTDDWTWEVIKMRQWVTRWINAARFMDDLGLQINAPELKGKVHRVEQPGTCGFLVNFWNTARREWPAENKTLRSQPWKPYKITQKLSPLGKVADWTPKRAFLIEMGKAPRPLEFKVNNGILEYEIPAIQLCGVLFVREASGPFQYLARSQQVDYKQLDVEILNVTGHDLSGNVKLTSIDFQIPDAEKKFTAKSGIMQTLVFPYKNSMPPALTSLVNVNINIPDNGNRTLRGATYPFLDDASFEKSSWLYYSNIASSGKRSMMVKPKISEKLMLRLYPDTKYRLTCKIRQLNPADKKVICVWFFNWKGAQGRFDGKDLYFRQNTRPTANWKTVEMTFKTPPMCLEMPLTIRAYNGAILLDDFKLEKLSADAKVKHLPNYDWSKLKK